jgi:Fe-Mn family superoxide dismutase
MHTRRLAHSLARPLAIAALIALPLPVLAQDAEGPFTLPELPYAYDALEPVIDAETMELHHSRHHQTFVDNLNEAVAEGTLADDLTVEAIVAAASTYPDTIRNNAGGHWNHSFFWEIMAPTGEGGAPSEELLAAIEAVYGSLQSFQEAFEEAGTAGRSA